MQGISVTDHYRDREQTRAKHDILERYLKPFSIKILSAWGSIDFIDGFAGPWKNTDTVDLTDTSIGVALRTLSAVAEAGGHSPGSPQIRCIFNEKSTSSYALLQDYVSRARAEFPLIDIQTFHGEFAQNAPAIRAASTNKFRLLFIDPTGYTGFPPAALKLFGNRSSEIIVNFMRSFMERFVSGSHRDNETALVGLVGAQRARFLLDIGADINAVEEEYLKMLRDDLGYKYAGYSPIHNPDRDQIHFNLAFATYHPMGMETMRKAEFDALTEYDRARFTKKRAPEDDLFERIGDRLAIRGPYQSIREMHVKRAGIDMLTVLADHPTGVQFGQLAALMQQKLYLKQTELKDVIVDLTSTGLIEPDWKRGRNRKPSLADTIRAVR